MIEFVKTGIHWAKTIEEIHQYLGGDSGFGATEIFKVILDDLDVHKDKNDQQDGRLDGHDADLLDHEARIALLESQMPIALAS